ncbi:MAG: fibronectin type III domain-containing protein, partial [Candidatus Peribacteraceae bacterium]
IDLNGKRVEDYTGTVLLSSTDPTALLPLEGRVSFRPQDLGQKTLTLGLRFRTSGEHILHVEDSTDPSVNTQVNIKVVGDTGEINPTITITSHEQDGYINSTEIVLEGTGAPFINLIVTGGAEDVRSETTQDGTFSVPVVLNPELTDHTLRIRDESGRYDSGNLHLILDTVPAEIKLVTFAPITPEEGDPMTLVVESDADLQSVTMTLVEEEYTLTQNAEHPGTYELTFNAPASGTYQPIVKASDAAGNITEVRSNIAVGKRSLPRVENITAEAKVDTVILRWDPVTSERVDAYRIYVGEDPKDFLYTLDTGRASATATVAGLSPNTSYYFAVTALQGERESIEKSEIAEARTLGMGLSIEEQDSALLIEWSSMPQETPLASYILEYGVEPDVYTEQRTINGDQLVYTLRDLMNGITYFLKLTPVTTTGNVLRELSVTGSGTPNGQTSTYTPQPGEQPIPGGYTTPVSTLPIGSVHSGAPQVPSTGLPPVAWWLAISLATLLLYMQWHRRRTLKYTLDFLQQMESRYHE